MMKKIFCFSVLFFALFFLGCARSEVEDAKPPAEAVPKPAKAIQSTPTSSIAKIVFVGQKQACNCTRDRIDRTWKTLQESLGGRKDIAIESIELDVDEDRYDEMDRLQSMIVPPGLYFFDSNDKFVKMLQGELEAGQIAEALK